MDNEPFVGDSDLGFGSEAAFLARVERFPFPAVLGAKYRLFRGVSEKAFNVNVGQKFFEFPDGFDFLPRQTLG
jgi:hypothetical protein